ncbi:Tn3 family transposase, partial [Klebsiella pneumoniae]|uniref:Tn3 family transposase n=1 Tax=Klebsiella pneumoniae TaxID=573 RepID=UPI0025572895
HTSSFLCVCFLLFLGLLVLKLGFSSAPSYVFKIQDIFRCAATMTAGKIRPIQLLRKLASYPRQNNLAVELREVGRIERTLFIIEWILDTDMQRRAQIGLNKGEAHPALKNALRIGRQGEIRDRTTAGQHYRIAGLNLLTAVIIYWNTVHLVHAVTERRNEGLDVPPESVPYSHLPLPATS